MLSLPQGYTHFKKEFIDTVGRDARFMRNIECRSYRRYGHCKLLDSICDKYDRRVGGCIHFAAVHRDK